jgi:hypothetical protein
LKKLRNGIKKELIMAWMKMNKCQHLIWIYLSKF